jgi:hypothetical protein
MENQPSNPQIIGVNLEIPGTFLDRAGGLLWGAMFKKIIVDALEKKEILLTTPDTSQSWIFNGNGPSDVLAIGQYVMATFQVTDLPQGLLTIESELQNFGLLGVAQIAWPDCKDGAFRPYLCSGCKPITSTGPQLYLEWLAKVNLMLVLINRQ